MKRLLASVVLIVTMLPLQAESAASSQRERFTLDSVIEGLDQPWAIDFLPDGSIVVTEKPGKLRIIDSGGRLSDPIGGVPEVESGGQGGLLDVAVHPDFRTNRLIYLSFSEADNNLSATAVARGRLSEDGRRLENVETIFRQEPKVASAGHYGARIVFDGKGHVFVTLGDRQGEAFRLQAQDLGSLIGKVVRLNEDGGIPSDNPFAGRTDARAEIWSYGHRNIQAAALDRESGKLWAIEHGPMGGDEVNILQAGGNYGWPLVSHGLNYDGSPVGSGKSHQEGMLAPLYQWTPVIAPSGMIFYEGDAFPNWKGSLFVGGLRGTALIRLEREGETITGEERLLEDLGERIRDVAEGPKGSIYVLTDGEGARILKLTPVVD